MRILALALTLGLVLALAGCAPPVTRPGEYRAPPSSLEGPTLGVPPSYYDNDPNFKYWYTPPYFDPYVAGP